MKVIEDMAAWRNLRRDLVGSIGFVPTMGALHDGHASLMRHSVAANDLVLHAGPLAAGMPGMFFHGADPAMVPFGEGFLCTDGSLVRIPPPIFPDATDVLSHSFDNTVIGGLHIAPGITRHFQCWYRDPAGGPIGFNLSDGLSITFTP